MAVETAEYSIPVREEKFEQVEEVDDSKPTERNVAVETRLSWIEEAVWNPWNIFGKRSSNGSISQAPDKELCYEHVEQSEVENVFTGDGNTIEIDEERVEEQEAGDPSFFDIPLTENFRMNVDTLPENHAHMDQPYSRAEMPKTFV